MTDMPQMCPDCLGTNRVSRLGHSERFLPFVVHSGTCPNGKYTLDQAIRVLRWEGFQTAVVLRELETWIDDKIDDDDPLDLTAVELGSLRWVMIK